MLQVQRAGPIIYPFFNAWGAINLNNLTAGVLYASPLENAGLGVGSASIGFVPWPAKAGKVKYLAVRMRSAALAVDTVWTVFIGGLPTALSVTLPAAQAAVSMEFEVAVPFIATGNVVHIQWTSLVAPGAANVRPIVSVSGQIIG